MLETAARTIGSKHLGKVAGALVLLVGLTFLVGCQGVSAAGSSSQQQSSTLSLLSASLDFGSVAAGSSKTLTVSATNSGAASLTVSSASISTKYYSLISPSLPITVAAGQNITISIKFAPNAAGAFNATLAVTSVASNTVASSTATNLTLSGTGTGPGQLILNPATEDFGSVTVGAKQSQTVTLTNTGGSSVNISQASVSGAGFQISGISTPLTLNASQSTTFTVAFAPQASGSASGTVTMTSDASTPAPTVALSGTGVALGALGSNPTSLSFGSVTVGSKQSLSETVTNTGGSTVTISQLGVSGAGFSLSGITVPVTLTAGQSAAFTVTLTPQSVGTASGNLTVTSNASNPTLTIPLSGTGVALGTLGSNLTSLSFGSVIVGSKQSLSETVTNTGGSTVTISQVGISGTGFSLSGITAPITLTAGQSATFSVTFTPPSVGSVNGNLTITSTASNPDLTVSLSGTGIAPGALGSNPTSLSFGGVTVGSSQSLSETVTNTGGSSVTISQVGISGSGFSLSGITAPTTLTAGQSTTFTVTFTPQSAANASGNVTITSTAPNPTLAIPLSGTGMAPGALGSNPTSLSFGGVTVGSPQSLSATVTNTGGSSVTISQVGISGTGFSLSGITAPITLTAGQSTTFTVTFAPQSAANVSGNVTITSTGSNPTLTIPLSGTGTALGTLGSNPASLSFGSVTAGSKQSLSETVTNTGGSTVTISQVGISGTGFSLSGITAPVTLTAGQSASITVSFSPASAGTVSGNVTITSNASNPTLTVPLSGTGILPGILGSNPSSLSFGSVTVGSGQSVSETVSNTGGSSVTISQVGISGAGFSLSGINAPVTLPAGQSASFSVSFAPQSAGAVSGNVTITSNASNPTLAIPLSGAGTTAVGQLTVTPSTLGLGSVVVGTSGTAAGSLTAAGATVTVTAASTNNSVFSVGGLSLPVTIPAGQSTSFTVTFSPQVTGVASATLSFTSNAQPSTTTEALTGSGMPAPVHTVNLSWNASTSPNISGYNIYRAVFTTSCGSYAKINSVLDTSTLYTDSSVVDGTAYCYASTAVNTSNEESGYSNIVSNIQIPPP
ncbi:MAG: choice-of-anchor D domain-containing protein [Candidatus Sulfotelmatobacter sp.]